MSSARGGPVTPCATPAHRKVTATETLAGALTPLDVSAGLRIGQASGAAADRSRSWLTGCSAVAWVPMGLGQTRDAECTGRPPDE
jgi:hypothetical protein